MARSAGSTAKRRLSNPVISGFFVLGGALITATPALIQIATNTVPAAVLQQTAEDVLELPNVPDLSAGANTAQISGKLKRPLPPGRQIFVASQGPVSAQTPGRFDAGNLTFYPPCSVDSSSTHYTCDDVQLGLPADGGVYVIYIGLADSSAARAMTHGLYKQAYNAGAKLPFAPNPAPDAGFDVAGDGIRVNRIGSSPSPATTR